MGLLILCLFTVALWAQDSVLVSSELVQSSSATHAQTVTSSISDSLDSTSILLQKNENDSILASAKRMDSVIVQPQSTLLITLLQESGEGWSNMLISSNGKPIGKTDEDGFLEVTVPFETLRRFSLGTDSLVLEQKEFNFPEGELFEVSLIANIPKSIITDSIAKEADMVVTAEREALHERKEVSKIEVKREEMQEVAATQGDPMRVIHSLPGVTSQSDLNVRPFVRGGDEKETRVFWNNVPIIQPYHALSMFSVYNMEAIDKVSFYSGAFPVEGNNALSGALFFESRPAPLDTANAFLHLSMLRGNAYVGVPVIKDKFGVYASYQALWYDWLIKRTLDVTKWFTSDKTDAEINKYQKFTDLPNFKDLEFGWNWKIKSGLTLDYTGLISSDVFRVLDPRSLTSGLDSIEQTITKIDTLALVDLPNQVHGLNLNWIVSPKWFMKTTLAWQNQDWLVKFPNSDDKGLSFSLNRQGYHWRNHNIYELNDSHTFTFGASYDYWKQRYNIDMPRFIYELLVRGNADFVEALGHYGEKGFKVTASEGIEELGQLAEKINMKLSGTRSQHFIGAYLSHEFKVNKRNKIVSGVRVEGESTTKEIFPAPRLAWYHQLTEQQELSFGAGLYSQNQYEFFYRHHNKKLKAEKNAHLNAEYSIDFTPNYRLELANYAKYYWDLASFSLGPEHFINGEAKRDFRFDNTGVGLALGSELSFKYDPDNMWRGWASIAVGSSQRRNTKNGIWYNFSTYRPWALKWHNFFDMSNNWTLALKWSYTAGLPYTPFTDFNRLTSTSLENLDQNTVLFEIGEKNSAQYSAYSRFDIRISQKGTLFGLPFVKFFEIWNAFNEPNFLLLDSKSGKLKNIQFNYPFPIFFVGSELRW